MSAGRILTLGLGNPFAGRRYLPTLGFGTGGVAPVAPSAPIGAIGNWNWDKKRKKPRVIRLSDLESSAELEKAIREEIHVIPMSAVSDAPIIYADDEEEDDILILAAAMKMLQ